MRGTGSYTFGGLAGGLAFLPFLWMQMPIVGIIVGIIVGFIVYKIVWFIGGAFDKGVDTLLYGKDRSIRDELLPKHIFFETHISKDKIGANFAQAFPSETKAIEWKPSWICGRGKESLLFACGVQYLSEVDNDTPMTVAVISFENGDDSKTKARFHFVKYTTNATGALVYPEESAPFAKQMAELVDRVKEVFLRLDRGCIISESVE